jgi:hypothetical protein
MLAWRKTQIQECTMEVSLFMYFSGGTEQATVCEDTEIILLNLVFMDPCIVV